MPSMASVILRAAARAASSAAWAASRCAAAAEAAAARSGSGGAAASDPLMRASSVAATATARSPASSGSIQSRLFHATQPRSIKPVFEAEEKDLESDEALWALYERWCKFFNQERDRDEMARRFGHFKKTVLRVEEKKKSDVPYRLGINQFADGKLAELYRNGCSNRGVPYSASPFLMITPDDLLFEEDPGDLLFKDEASNPYA